MAFLDNLSKKLSDAGQSVSQQTKNIGEINRLNGLINENRKSISDLCFQLGKAYYQAHYGDAARCGTQVGEVAPKPRICPGCGKTAPEGSSFCVYCGTKLN